MTSGAPGLPAIRLPGTWTAHQAVPNSDHVLPPGPGVGHGRPYRMQRNSDVVERVSVRAPEPIWSHLVPGSRPSRTGWERG
jgi:hypothetical protein